METLFSYDTLQKERVQFKTYYYEKDKKTKP